MLALDKIRVGNIWLNAAMIMVFVTALAFVTKAQTADKENYIDVVGKVLSIDPIKGDVTVRLEFEPHGNFVKEDGTLARNLKFDINSSNGKQEVSFDKGKRLTSTEAVLNMYNGSVTDYPFDSHEADLMFFFTVKPDKPADKPADKPKPADEQTPPSETKPAPTAEDEPEEVEVPISLEFTPTMAGYKIESVKNKESDETYVDVTMKIARAPMVTTFAVVVMAVMWVVSIAVLFLAFTVIVRGRKPELAMLSFIAALIFSFAAVRNSQPAVPPIGTFSDYASFFWAEIILAICLLSVLFAWLIRPNGKQS